MVQILTRLKRTALAVGGIFAIPHRISQHTFLRAFGMAWVLAFWSLYTQVAGLMGPDGLTPIRAVLELYQQQLGNTAWLQAPTLFWIDGGSWTGIMLVHALGVAGGAAMVFGFAPFWGNLLALICYGSLIRVGIPWMGFAQDALLMELGFVTLFLCSPRWGRLPSVRDLHPNRLGVFMINLLLAKLMFNSGMAKLNGSILWQDATALMVHFQSQPLPTIGGWWAHHLPQKFLRSAVWASMFVELALPFYMILPRVFRSFAACCFMAYMLLIHLTGNFGLLNLLVLLMALFWVDDRSWHQLMPRGWRPAQPPVKEEPSSKMKARLQLAWVLLWAPITLHGLIASSAATLLPPWRDAGQFMQALKLSNRYPLFDDVTHRRSELEVQTSHNGVDWRAQVFRYKPSNPYLAPRYAGFHLPRLDMQFWEAGKTAKRPDAWKSELWVSHLIRGLLDGNPYVYALFLDQGLNPDGPPRYARVLIYDSVFTDPVRRRQTGRWWDRKLVGEYLPTVRGAER